MIEQKQDKEKYPTSFCEVSPDGKHKPRGPQPRYDHYGDQGQAWAWCSCCGKALYRVGDY